MAESRRVEGVDQIGRACAEAHMCAAVRRCRLQVTTQVDPELGILLAEADGGRALLQRGEAERAEHGLVETRRGGEIAHGNGDVVNHRAPPAALTPSRPTSPA